MLWNGLPNNGYVHDEFGTSMIFFKSNQIWKLSFSDFQYIENCNCNNCCMFSKDVSAWIWIFRYLICKWNILNQYYLIVSGGNSICLHVSHKNNALHRAYIIDGKEKKSSNWWLKFLEVSKEIEMFSMWFLFYHCHLIAEISRWIKSRRWRW